MAAMTDEQRRIRSYLQAQGAKLSPADIIGKVRAAMEEVREALFSVKAERFNSRPDGDEWSANEVMAHVVSAGAHFGNGIMRVLDGAASGPPVADRIEGGASASSAAAWWDLLVRDREALFARVLGADPNAHLDRAITHPMFGPLTWREALLFVRLHDLDHAGQLRKIAGRLP
jgi:uncharacterized protein YfiM (DUF2279 family)